MAPGPEALSTIGLVVQTMGLGSRLGSILMGPGCGSKADLSKVGGNSRLQFKEEYKQMIGKDGKVLMKPGMKNPPTGRCPSRRREPRRGSMAAMTRRLLGPVPATWPSPVWA